MYKWITVGCAIGFGLGLIFISEIFKMALAPFGNPLNVDYTTWDWNSQAITWQFLGMMWILAGIVALYILIRTQEKAKQPPKESSPKKRRKTSSQKLPKETS